MQPLPPEKHEDAEIAAGFLSAMANPKRLLILDSLVKEEMAVGALAHKVGLSQSALSQHLSKLRAQNLVSTRRDAQTIYYSSSSDAVLKILGALSDIYGDDTDAVEGKASRSQIGVISQDVLRPNSTASSSPADPIAGLHFWRVSSLLLRPVADWPAASCYMIAP